MHIGAIILAAGSSSRMGGFKPLFSIGPKTLLGHAISLFQHTDIADIVVVTGHQSEDLQRELHRYCCRSVFNANFGAGMLSSIKVGLNALDSKTEAFFLLPADIPLVRQETIQNLLAAMSQNHHALVFYPVYKTRRGHPPLIKRDLAAAILSYDDRKGLRTLLNRYGQQAHHLAVDDPYILRDVDTQDDLVFLQQQYLQGSAPA